MYRKPANSADVRWYVADGVVGEVDVNGNLTSSTKRDVYGLTRSASGAATTRQGFVGQSCGHMTDPETGGLVYMRARYYDAGVGRFISQDPVASGNNWFVYANNDPVDRVDANGRDADTINLIITWTIRILNDAPEGKMSLAVAIATLRRWIARLEGISSVDTLQGQNFIDEGVSTTEEGAAGGELLSDITARLGELQEGLGAEKMGVGVVAKLSARQLELAVEILEGMSEAGSISGY